MSNAFVSILCIGLFMLAFIVLLIVALVSASKRKKEVGDAASQMGFNPLPEPDAELLAHLTNLYAPYPVRKVSNAYRKPFGSETYYLFDCQTDNPGRNSEQESSSNNEFGNIGIISPYLDLPSFMLLPRFPAMPMGLSGMMENLLSMVAQDSGLSEFSVVTPAFSSKYMLFVREDERVEKVFTPEVQDWIARQEQLVARGENDFFIFNRYTMRMKNGKETSQLSELLESARHLCDFLVTKKS
ncbi:hypothetical protein SDC9_79754 [bioreactor metagenome]|uniref:Uncharacterized protein n=1 Tax=bioreactor metagenome TaxID=1076179 RepID=A0A644YX61_9ZZZZ